jgi:hypothetical protein
VDCEGLFNTPIRTVHVVNPQHDTTPDPSGRADVVELKVEVASADPEAGEWGDLGPY